LCTTPQLYITSEEQLTGGLFGVAGRTGAHAKATKFFFKKLGLVPGKDTSVIVIGGTPERLIALRTGKIHATLLNPPTTFVAQREGFNVLADLGTLPFQNNGVVTTRKFINDKPEVVRRYVKSQIEAVHLMKSERATGLKVLAKYMGGTSDQELLEKSYDASVTEHTFPAKQYPSQPGLKTVIDSLVADNPKAKEAKPEDFIDSQFIKELDDRGFIDNLKSKKS
jgi:ABC-type nitrate/sulfonate/bicarbonate transport system substrate-binding protein